MCSWLIPVCVPAYCISSSAENQCVYTWGHIKMLSRTISNTAHAIRPGELDQAGGAHVHISFAYTCFCTRWLFVCVCHGFPAKSTIFLTHFLPLQVPEPSSSGFFVVFFTLDVSLVPRPISHNPLPLFQQPVFTHCPPHLFHARPARRFSPFIFGQLFPAPFSPSAPLSPCSLAGFSSALAPSLSTNSRSRNALRVLTVSSFAAVG